MLRKGSFNTSGELATPSFHVSNDSVHTSTARIDSAAGGLKGKLWLSRTCHRALDNTATKDNSKPRSRSGATIRRWNSLHEADLAETLQLSTRSSPFAAMAHFSKAQTVMQFALAWDDPHKHS
jgi:hypothetical protein